MRGRHDRDNDYVVEGLLDARRGPRTQRSSTPETRCSSIYMGDAQYPGTRATSMFVVAQVFLFYQGGRADVLAFRSLRDGALSCLRLGHRFVLCCCAVANCSFCFVSKFWMQNRASTNTFLEIFHSHEDLCKCSSLFQHVCMPTMRFLLVVFFFWWHKKSSDFCASLAPFPRETVDKPTPTKKNSDHVGLSQSE